MMLDDVIACYCMLLHVIACYCYHFYSRSVPNSFSLSGLAEKPAPFGKRYCSLDPQPRAVI